MTDARTVSNAIVLANATELVVGVIEKIAGNAIATTLEGKSVSGEELRNLVAARLQLKLSNLTGEL